MPPPPQYVARAFDPRVQALLAAKPETKALAGIIRQVQGHEKELLTLVSQQRKNVWTFYSVVRSARAL